MKKKGMVARYGLKKKLQGKEKMRIGMTLFQNRRPCVLICCRMIEAFFPHQPPIRVAPSYGVFVWGLDVRERSACFLQYDR